MYDFPEDDNAFLDVNCNRCLTFLKISCSKIVQNALLQKDKKIKLACECRMLSASCCNSYGQLQTQFNLEVAGSSPNKKFRNKKFSDNPT